VRNAIHTFRNQIHIYINIIFLETKIHLRLNTIGILIIIIQKTLTTQWDSDNKPFFIRFTYLIGLNEFCSNFSGISHEPDDRQSIGSTTTNNPNEITSTPAVDFEFILQILIANGSCNFYTRRDLISQSPLTPNLTKQQTQATVGLIQTINKIEYQVLQFSLPGVDVDAQYNSKHNNTTNSSLNKRGSFYCRAMIQSPTTQILIHPILLDFFEQTLEYVNLPREQQRRGSIREEKVQDQNTDDDHLNTM